jgi:hypothetical protein
MPVVAVCGFLGALAAFRATLYHARIVSQDCARLAPWDHRHRALLLWSQDHPGVSEYLRAVAATGRGWCVHDYLAVHRHLAAVDEQRYEGATGCSADDASRLPARSPHSLRM